MKIRLIQFLIFLNLFILFNACQQNSFDIDLKGQEIETNLIRFDKELMTTTLDSLGEKAMLWDKKYPIFFSTYTYGILQIGGVENKNFMVFFKKFRNNPITKDSYSDIEEKYPSFKEEKEKIDKAFSYYHHYFPHKEIPHIYTILSGFNQSIAIDSASLLIALDKYLGANDAFYDRLAIPYYLRKKFTKEYITVDCMRAIAWSEFPFKGEDNMANNMIYEGKVQYFLEATLPFVEDSLKMGYSDEQLEWCKRNEKKIWNAIVDNEMLYQSNPMQIKNMVKESPFTQPFGNQSPPKLGVWIAWQIVRSYMKEHPDVSLQELMENKDCIAVLNASSYNP